MQHCHEPGPAWKRFVTTERATQRKRVLEALCGETWLLPVARAASIYRPRGGPWHGSGRLAGCGNGVKLTVVGAPMFVQATRSLCRGLAAHGLMVKKQRTSNGAGPNWHLFVLGRSHDLLLFLLLFLLLLLLARIRRDVEADSPQLLNLLRFHTLEVIIAHEYDLVGVVVVVA